MFKIINYFLFGFLPVSIPIRLLIVPPSPIIHSRSCATIEPSSCHPPLLLQTRRRRRRRRRTSTSTSTSTSTITINMMTNVIISEEANSLFSVSFPIALTSLLLYSRSVLSMLFLGSLGDLPLAAGSLAIAFANITGYSVLSGLSLGMDPLCSQSFGAHQPKLLLLTLYRSVLFLLLSSLPITLLWLSMPSILSIIFTHDHHQILHLAHKYLLFSLPDLLSFSLIHPIRIFLRSQGITKPLAVTASIAALLHLPLNFLFVNKLHLGIVGVAIASASSNIALLLLLLAHLHSSSSQFFEEGPPTCRDCLNGWGPLARLAFPSCVSVCLEWWWYEIMILLCGFLPDPKPAIASMGVLIQTTALVYVFPSSLGFGVSTRVGNELGANRPQKAKRSATVSLVIAVCMGFLAMGFAALMRERWGRMFTNDAEILRLTAAALPIVGLCEIGNCPQTVGCGVLRGTARPAHAAHVNLGAFYLVGMPVGLGLGFGIGFGFCGLWVGLLAAQVCCAGMMMYVVGTTDWETQAKRAQELTCGEPGKHVSGEDDHDDEAKKCYEPLISVVVSEIER